MRVWVSESMVAFLDRACCSVKLLRYGISGAAMRAKNLSPHRTSLARYALIFAAICRIGPVGQYPQLQRQ
jgi:hypothetical protein